ncbi:hypothetical protein ACFQH3_12270 [Haladaptatus sp. GCM10025707]|uniref:hypothetical protein n=1 Tax=unclassified Haladaptatus TaxID=2622732 RepID=UPI0023E850D2|nr:MULTISPECIES: hypothetical protein [unclassified Haladaptatus]
MSDSNQRTARRTSLADELPDWFVFGGVFVLAMLFSTWRVAYLELGQANTLFYDAQIVWKPLTEQVMGGVPLYTGPAVDNKPPLFQYVNLIAGYTGEYNISMTLLVGIANALTAGLVYRWRANHGEPREGIAIAILYLATLPLVNGLVINARSFAMVGLMIAVIYTQPGIRGGAVAVAGLFSQYSFFAVPVLVVHSSQRTQKPLRWLMVFTATALCIVGMAFASVGVIWGTESMTNAMYYSMSGAGEYVTSGNTHSPFHSVTTWFGILSHTMVNLAWLLIPTTLGGLLVVIESFRVPWSERTFALALGVSLSLPLFIRSLLYYWIPALPFFGLLAVHALSRFLAGSSHEER